MLMGQYVISVLIKRNQLMNEECSRENSPNTQDLHCNAQHCRVTMSGCLMLSLRAHKVVLMGNN